jgi:DNA-binding CsgD family transcriptional regulator
MEAISVRKAQALIRSVETLGSVQSLKQFPSAVFSALGEIIEGAVFSLVTINLKTGEVVSEASDNVLMLLEINNRIMEMRSANRAIPTVLPGAKGLIRFTACTCQWQFEQTPLHADGLVPASVRQQTVVTLDIPGYNASVTVNRDTDFSDEETILLSLAVPHLALVHRNLQRLESLREAAKQVIPGPNDLERVGLTSREAEVLHWAMKGKQDGAIAGILMISVRTVHQHVAHILRKLQSESRASAGYEAMLKLKELGSDSQAV